MTNEENMKLWNSVSDTDPAYIKRVKLGRYEFCDIDAHWNLKRATAKWGSYGSTWGLRHCAYNLLQCGENSSHGFMLEATFWYPGGEFDIAADMPYEPKGETLKKLQTMCIGKALSRLGFSADVYMGKFEDSAYVAEQEKKYAEQRDDNSSAGSNSDSVVDPPVKVKHKKYPEPDPTASGILGTLAQKYVDILAVEAINDSTMSDYVVSFKKVCRAVYDVFGKYPTKIESIPKLLEAVPLTAVIDKNDFLEGM